VACHPQAWAAGAVPYMLQTSLGLQPEAFERRLRVVRPTLPPFVDRLELSGLRIAGGSVDLRFQRTRDGIDVETGEVKGGIEVVIER
jgi:glycogen debranching enzyme